MKENTIKWCLQLFLSSLLLFLTIKYSPYFLGRGHQADVVIGLFCIPLANTIGPILGDLSLYRGEKLCGWAVVAAIFLAVLGMFVGLLLQPAPGSVPPFIAIPLFYSPMIMLPLIGYNTVTLFGRKHVSRDRDETKK